MDYIPIRVNTLRGDQKIEFDVYIKINEKMLLYLRRGDSFAGERLQRLKSKKLKKMFILHEDEASYRHYLQSNLEIAYDDKTGKDIQTRAEIIHGEQQSRVEEVFEQPEQEESYLLAKEGAAQYVQFLLKNEGAKSAVLKIENSDSSLSHHGVSVATLSVGLAQKLGLPEAKILQTMTLGALLHDIGHQELGFESILPLKMFSPEQMAKYKQHPQLGTAKAQELKHFDQMVLNIIAQHEECADGSGYPKGMKEKEMDPHVVIVSSANAVDRLIAFEGVPRTEAAKKMMIEQIGRHPLAHIQGLHDLLKEQN